MNAKRRTLAFVISTAALFGQSPTVSGTLTVDGKPHTVTSACAYEEQDPFDKKNMRLVTLLWTDGKPLEGPCRDFMFTLQRRLRAGTTLYLSAIVQTPAMTWEYGTLGAGDAPISFSYSGNDPATKFEPASASKDTLSGSFLTVRPLKIADSPRMEIAAKVTAVPIERETPVSAEVTGPAAANSPAAKAAIRFLTAMSNGDMKAVRAMIAQDERARFDEDIASPEGKQMVDMMTTMAKGTLGLPVASIATQGAVTIVTLEKKTEGGKESATFKLRQENGEYRITRKR